MSARKVLAVGVPLASDHVTDAEFDSTTSLLDWDVVLFRPDYVEFFRGSTTFRGKPSLSESASFSVQERSEHWRREIAEAVATGKTVVVFLPPYLEFWVRTGEKEHSGTGRNRQTTNIVTRYDNFRCIPANLEPVGTQGASIKIAPKQRELLKEYWDSFGEASTYNVILTANDVQSAFLTRNGDKAVGAIYRSTESAGALLLLPDLDLDQEGFSGENEAGEPIWTDEAEQFAARLLMVLVSLDRALKASGEVTPAPAWVTAHEFQMPGESGLRSSLLSIESQLEELRQKKEGMIDELRKVASLRNLLFEKGRPLEQAILEAVALMGFSAAPFSNADSEFDVVFEAAEGRLIGEVEGKDSKAINVDKLRQLSMNLHEDLQREEVNDRAKGVLFGNGFRLSPLAGRPTQFTDKCIRAAASSGVGLVTTSSLFVVAQYLAGCRDAKFATQCRRTLVGESGLLALPGIPSAQSKPRRSRSR